jgi:hypothetical protein
MLMESLKTGLPVVEVLQREKDLHLIPASEAYAGSTPSPRLTCPQNDKYEPDPIGLVLADKVDG